MACLSFVCYRWPRFYYAKPRFIVFGTAAILLFAVAGEASAAETLLGQRGPGGYLSALKLGLVALVFFIWVRLADWMNQDSVRIGELSGLKPELWNPLNLAAQLLGFFAAISIPIFWVGFPIYVFASLFPWALYRLIRRSKMKQDSSIKQKLNPDAGLEMETLVQDAGAELSFSAAGADDTAQQANLIHARQSTGFPVLKDLLIDCMLKRADTLMIDYSAAQAAPRILVDGAWHALPPMERATGDSVLVSLKCLAGLNPADRRNRQSGRFNLKSPDYGKRRLDVASQGVQNGERVQVKFVGSASDKLPLKQLGMLPEMQKHFVPALNQPGICIVSAPKGEGLTTTWQGMLLSADRLTRDCVGLVSPEIEEETALENIVIRHYDPTGKTHPLQKAALDAALLTRPDSVAVPAISTPDIIDTLTKSVSNQDTSIWLQASSSSTVEALIKQMKHSTDKTGFANAVRFVTNQRLARRLCDSCKQQIQVQPKLIQQLGGDPKKQKTIFQAYRLPPPEQRVDQNGKPIEFPPCPSCGGLGHIGRIALFELLTVNDQVRKAMIEKGTAAAVDAAAKSSGAKMPMTSSAWKLVLLGVISLQEAQQSLKK